MQIDKLKESIICDYGNVNYVVLSGDRKLQNVSTALYKLWYSTEVMSIATLDMYYRRSLDNSYPEYTKDKFLSEALELKNVLSQEFAKITKSERRG